MKTKKIKDPLYDRDITLVYECEHEAFLQYVEKKHKHLKLDRYFTYAEHISVSSDDSWVRHYIWIKRNDFYIKDYGIIIHEVFHCVRDCFDEIGLGITESTNEAFAYYQEYIFEQILSELLRKQKTQ